MGGGIGVTSVEGQGSDFWFTVRMGLCSAAAEAVPELHVPTVLAGIHVLIADDHAANREMLARQLEFWGLRCEVAANGSDALQALYLAHQCGDPIGIAVLDMQMPGMDGEAASRAILADPRLADTRLIMLTAFGSQFGPQRCREIGVHRWVNKPIRRADLLAALELSLQEPEKETPTGACETAANRGTNEPSTPIFRGNHRILVTEDNFTNQLVALGILKRLGLRADAASDGAEALQLLETIPYDLVLMDMCMPVMDGIEATLRIRDPHSKVLNHAVPIVAMTANVQPADQKRCLDVGMNGFVSKPVSPGSVRAALEKLLPAGPAEPASVTALASAAPGDAVPSAYAHPRPPSQMPCSPLAALPSDPADPLVFNRAGLFERMMEDEYLVNAVLGAFLDDLPRLIQIMKEQLQASDAHASGRTAHSIKGTSANLGAERLRQLANEIEIAGHRGDLDAIRTAIPELEARFYQFMAATRSPTIPAAITPASQSDLPAARS